MSVTVPVVAIGGVDASNAAACIRAGAAGVAAIRAATDPQLRAAVDAALRARRVRAARPSSSGEVSLSESRTTPPKLPDGLVVTQDALVEGVHFRLDWLSWRDLGFRAAAVNLSDLAASGADPEGLVVSLAHPGERRSSLCSTCTRGSPRPVCRWSVGTRPPRRTCSSPVTALGRSPRIPGRGGAARRSRCRHRPARRRAVRPSVGEATCVLRSGSPRDERWPRGRTRCWTSPTVLRPTLGTSAARSGCRLVIELERVPLASEATVDDLAFGEDFELLAAVAEPADFPVIGRCEEGAGVEFLLDGEPYALGGYEHFS